MSDETKLDLDEIEARAKKAAQTYSPATCAIAVDADELLGLIAALRASRSQVEALTKALEQCREKARDVVRLCAPLASGTARALIATVDAALKPSAAKPIRPIEPIASAAKADLKHSPHCPIHTPGYRCNCGADGEPSFSDEEDPRASAEDATPPKKRRAAKEGA